MAIDVDCECGKRFKVPDSREGREIACPRCGRKFHAPLAVLRVEFGGSNPGFLGRIFGVVKLTAKVIVAVFLILFIFLFVSAMQTASTSRPPRIPDSAASPIPPVAAHQVSDPSTPAPSPVADPFPVGSRVETGAVTMFSTRERLAGSRSTGKPPAGTRVGQNMFGLSIGSTGIVLQNIGGDLYIRVESGSWSGRDGWLDIAGVRLCPTSDELATGIVDGLTLGQRREVYAEIHRAQSLASYEANRLYPIDNFQTGDVDLIKDRIESHESAYKSLSERWKQSMADRFGLSLARLDVIHEEGLLAHWPLPDVPKPDGPIAPPSTGKRADAPGARLANPKATLDDDPGDPRAATLLQMAKNLEKSGKTKPALENYRKIVAEFANTPSAKEASERIKALTGK